MTNFTSTIRNTNRSTAFLVFGLLITLAIVMFRPSGAEATLPDSIGIYSTPSTSSGTPDYIKLSDAPRITKTFDIKFNGEKKTRKTELEGVSLIDLLTANNMDPSKIPFVKIRLSATKANSTNDGQIALIPLAVDKTDTPPMVVNSWKGPHGALGTPAINPPQVSDAGIAQAQILMARPGYKQFTVVPAKEGAEILGVQVKSKKTSKGQYKLTASVVGDNPGSLSFEWFAGNDSGADYPSVGTGSTYTTTDATEGTSSHAVNVVVTSRTTGSTGANSFGYQSKKPDDGKKGDPFPDPTPATGTNGTGTGTGNGTGTGFGAGTGTVTPAPGTYTPPPTTTPSTPITPTPTAPTTTPTDPVTDPDGNATVDTSGIANVAQNISGTGALTTVTGVLLSSPTVPPSSGGGGTQLSQLPQPVATAATTIFKPVDSPDDLWPYLLSIMFALCFTGAVREWVNP